MHYVTAIINNSHFAWLFMEKEKLPVHAALDHVNILNVTFNVESLKVAQIKSS